MATQNRIVRLLERAEDLLVYLVADVGLALERDHVGKTRSGRDGDGRVRLAGVAVADVFHEQQGEHVVFVLRSVHAAAQFVAARPEGGIEFGFLNSHRGFYSSDGCGLRFLSGKQRLLLPDRCKKGQHLNCRGGPLLSP